VSCLSFALGVCFLFLLRSPSLSCAVAQLSLLPCNEPPAPPRAAKDIQSVL
jgi:hypothetical protein